MAAPARSPPRRRRALVGGAIAVAVVAVVVWWQVGEAGGGGRAPVSASRPAAGPRKPGVLRWIDGAWQRVDPRDPRARLVAPVADGMVRVEGMVYEGDRTRPVAGVEVVFSGPAGEETTMADGAGHYQLDVKRGWYRAFVRGDGVLSVGPRVDDRLPSPPVPGVAGVPDDQVAPSLVLVEDQHGIDLAVVRSALIAGRVTDRAGHPIAGAVVRARGDGGALRPVLGSDFAETESDGTYRLEVPASSYILEASHDRFAGLDGNYIAVSVAPGDRIERDLTLVAGCVVEGKVLLASGVPSGDGALERQWGSDENNFGPTGKVDADGSFRWATTEEDTIVLRAWPWKSTHSESRRFDCREGARYSGVTFTIPNAGPDMAGVVVDADGQPARYAYLDITALSPGGLNQQERADGDGEWGVYAMPPGDYQIDVFTPDGGVVRQIVTSPRQDIRLVLGGTGSIAGKAGFDAGSFTLALGGCDDIGRGDRLRRHRVVPVHNGTYRVDGIPACTQTIEARTLDREQLVSVTVPAGGIATADLNLAPRIKKRVVGVVLGPDGSPVEGATVTPPYADSVGAVTDSAGRFQIETYGGEGLSAYKGAMQGFAMVGDADVPVEHVEIRLSDMTVDEYLLVDPE
jgi:hypothetical protein